MTLCCKNACSCEIAKLKFSAMLQEKTESGNHWPV